MNAFDAVELISSQNIYFSGNGYDITEGYVLNMSNQNVQGNNNSHFLIEFIFSSKICFSL